MNNRRKFIKNFLAGAGAFSLTAMSNMAEAASVADAIKALNALSPEKAAVEDDYWWKIRQAYNVSANLINLNNGGVSPQPRIVADALKRYYDMSNEAPSYYMWRILNKDKEAVRQKLALLAGVNPEEIAIDRNTTEALDTVIFGLDLQPGDEVVLSDFDYPNMMNAWRMREKRHGVKLHWVSLPLPVQTDREIIKFYTDKFTSKTKVLHLTQVINWTGRIVPVKEICREAKKRGIFCMVDGAHAFAHLDFKIPELHADVFGTSLHKWLGAPFGTGMIWIKKDHIETIWPMFPDDDPERADIRKFENLGTRMEPSEIAIGAAVDFNNAIGIDRKEARLRYLKNYWVDRTKSLPGFQLNVPDNPELSGALAHFGFEGVAGSDIERYLLRNYRIHTSPVKYKHLDGVRISPNIYTSIPDLDKLVEALQTFSEKR